MGLLRRSREKEDGYPHAKKVGGGGEKRGEGAGGKRMQKTVCLCVTSRVGLEALLHELFHLRLLRTSARQQCRIGLQLSLLSHPRAQHVW